MAQVAANFPTSVWDGTSATRSDPGTIERAPDYHDWQQITAEVVAVQTAVAAQPLNNWTSEDAPAVTDDVTLGYGAGSLWLDTTGPTLYVCSDGTDGAAVWTELAPAA